MICAGFSPYLEGSPDLPSIAPYVDRINLMTTHFLRHLSAFYSKTWQAGAADHAVRYLDSLKIPRSKTAIGIAFYARQY